MKRISLWTVWKLRFKLWRMFVFDEWKNGKASNHRLKIWWHRPMRKWCWICVVPGKIGQYNIGPLQQWTLQEALSLAARKAEWVLHPDQEPVKDPEPNPPSTKHSKVYRLMDGGQFRIECACGWIGSNRCHGETTAPEWCRPCLLAEQSYGIHEIASQQLETVSQ